MVDFGVFSPQIEFLMPVIKFKVTPKSADFPPIPSPTLEANPKKV